jgi:phosphoribosylformylglycinamidine synthase
VAAEADAAGRILDEAARAGVPAVRIGLAGGGALTLSGGRTISLVDLRRAHEDWLPRYMDALGAAV